MRLAQRLGVKPTAIRDFRHKRRIGICSSPSSTARPGNEVLSRVRINKTQRWGSQEPLPPDIQTATFCIFLQTITSAQRCFTSCTSPVRLIPFLLLGAGFSKMSISNSSMVLERIATRLHEIFDGHISLADLAGKPKEHAEPFFRTRALAALSLLSESPISAYEAGANVTDGGADDGIDALYVDSQRNIVYFVQSKWRQNSNKGIELSDFNRFRDGVRDILSLNWNDENKNLHRFKSVLEIALSNIDTRIVMILAHTGAQPLGHVIGSKIAAFLKTQNNIVSDFMEVKEFALHQVAQTARTQARPEKIDVPALIEQWESSENLTARSTDLYQLST